MEEIFTTEFLIHEVSCTLNYIAKPAITLRFLEFPTLTVFGTAQKDLIFNKGKSCKFSMTLNTLRESLRRYPLYIMLVDAFPNNIKMLGSAAVDLSAFCDSGIPTSPDFKRNIINLQDPVKNLIARVDLSISISQYTDGIVRTPTEVFEKLSYENLKVTPVDRQSDKNIETEPLPVSFPGKTTKNSETMTVSQNETKEIQTSVFQEQYVPPPMFFTKAKTYTKPCYYPTAPPEYRPPQIPEQQTEMLLDKLIKEIQQLKQVSALQQNWSYPPVMSFAKPDDGRNEFKETAGFVDSRTEKSESRSAKQPSSKRSSNAKSEKKSSARSEKVSQEDYSEDFEEESVIKSSSREGFTKCFMCGERVKNSEARDHPNICKKINKEKHHSPHPGSSGTWGKEAMKSVTSIAEEYESDFEKASSYSSNR